MKMHTSEGAQVLHNTNSNPNPSDLCPFGLVMSFLCFRTCAPSNL